MTASLPVDGSDETFHYCFVAGEAFPLKINVMNPYARRMPTNEFYYRLSGARKSVEYAFGILNAKFKIFEGPIRCKEETVNSVIKASVVLYNFIRTREGLFCEGAENYALNQSGHHI
jgi:hypothetical protein